MNANYKENKYFFILIFLTLLECILKQFSISLTPQKRFGSIKVTFTLPRVKGTAPQLNRLISTEIKRIKTVKERKVRTKKKKYSFFTEVQVTFRLMQLRHKIKNLTLLLTELRFFKLTICTYFVNGQSFLPKYYF